MATFKPFGNKKRYGGFETGMFCVLMNRNRSNFLALIRYYILQDEEQKYLA